MITDKSDSLSAEATVQKIDTSEPLPKLGRVCVNMALKPPQDFRLPRLAWDLMLGALHNCVDVVMDGKKDVLDDDVGIPR